MVGVVVGGAEVADLPGDRIGVGVRDVHAGVAEAQTGEGCRHRHLGARSEVAAIVDGRTNDVAMRLSAFSDHMSAIGLDPQYGTRSSAVLCSYDSNGRAV